LDLKDLWQAPENDYEEFFDCFVALSLDEVSPSSDHGSSHVESRAPPESCTCPILQSSLPRTVKSIPNNPESNSFGRIPDAIFQEHLWAKLR
jgi:hypothetical protein